MNVTHYIQWIHRYERRFGLGVIWTYRKKGDKLRKVKLEYMNDGQFYTEMKSIGLDPRDIDLWINISLLCILYPEV